MTDENKEQEWIDKKPVRLTITAVLIAGLIMMTYDLFLSPDAPDDLVTEVQTEAEIMGDALAKSLLPEIIKENSIDNPEIDYIKEPKQEITDEDN